MTLPRFALQYIVSLSREEEEIIAQAFEFKSEDDKIIADKIFYTSLEFVKAAFGDADSKRDELFPILWELMTKLAKVHSEIGTFKLNQLACEEELKIKVSEGISGIKALELGKNIENFLTQSIGALDIFATQFLKNMFGYSHQYWNHEKIIKYLKKQKQLDHETVMAIEHFLNNAWDDWLEDFNSDRNQHHESNITLSYMTMIDNQPRLTLKRRSGEEVTDVIDYLQTHWKKVFWLIENMIRLSFCALRPHLKIIFCAKFKSFLYYGLNYP